MPTIIPVKFTYAARDLWFDPADTGAQEADHVICSTERGTEIGLATGDAREVSEEELEHVIGHAQLRSVVRIATDSDLDRAEQLAARGEDAMPTFRQPSRSTNHVSWSSLDMIASASSKSIPSGFRSSSSKSDEARFNSSRISSRRSVSSVGMSCGS